LCSKFFVFQGYLFLYNPDYLSQQLIRISEGLL
jgi:hypothetical protein